jgi:DNA-binding GntR family transcriptional regulator
MATQGGRLASDWYTGMAEVFRFERERAYRGIVDFLLSGLAHPGGPLSERKLSDSLAIGRTPVREALRDLARDGLLDVSPARGTYLRTFTAEDVREIYEARQGLEGLAAELAATRGPREN